MTPRTHIRAAVPVSNAGNVNGSTALLRDVEVLNPFDRPLGVNKIEEYFILFKSQPVVCDKLVILKRGVINDDSGDNSSLSTHTFASGSDAGGEPKVKTAARL